VLRSHCSHLNSLIAHVKGHRTGRTSTPGCPPRKPTTGPNCIPSPSASDTTSAPSPPDLPCPTARARSRATSTGLKQFVEDRGSNDVGSFSGSARLDVGPHPIGFLAASQRGDRLRAVGDRGGHHTDHDTRSSLGAPQCQRRLPGQARLPAGRRDRLPDPARRAHVAIDRRRRSRARATGSRKCHAVSGRRPLRCRRFHPRGSASPWLVRLTRSSSRADSSPAATGSRLRSCRCTSSCPGRQAA